MRIQEILGHLQFGDQLLVTREGVAGAHPPAFRDTNAGLVAEALEHLAEVVPLQPLVAACRRRPAFMAPSVDASEIATYESVTKELHQSAQGLAKMLRQCIGSPDENQLSIRLPQDVAGLDSLQEIIGTFESIFIRPTITLFGPENGAGEFAGFDIGSDWVNILHASKDALDFLLALLNVAAQLKGRNERTRRDLELLDDEEREPKRRKLEAATRIAEAEARMKEADADTAAAASQAKIVEHKLTQERATQELAELQHIRDGKTHADSRFLRQKKEELLLDAQKRGATPEAINEARVFVQNAIEEWARLLELGATVQHALNAPDDIKEAFPDPKLSGEILARRRQLLAVNPDEDDDSALDDEE